MSVHLVELSPDDMLTRMPEALRIYVHAMGYPRGTETSRAPMWAEHVHRPGWRAVAALRTGPGGELGGGELVGVGYGYRGGRGQWWSEEVRSGLLGARWQPGDVENLLTGCFELTELHVSPDAQGQRCGERLLAALLAGTDERRVLLSTPEIDDEDNRAWRLYRRTGFRDVLRHFRFTGDGRPFAVLGRDLPLP